MKLCRVVKPGLFTTIQDLGRKGFQRYGVPVSGAMDRYAFVAANLLVANSLEEAALEITLQGPELEFRNEAQISITGADLSPTLNGDSIDSWRTHRVRCGDVLTFGRAKMGLRAYIAVRGGINVPTVLGSRSTYTRGRFGGLEGRQLRADDVLRISEPTSFLIRGFAMPRQFVPRYGDKLVVKVVLGPQTSAFTRDGMDTFLSSVYRVTPESDRMGYRLDGMPIEVESSSMISDAIPVGAVQVPKSGKPIVMMRDAQTTGGYPKIAVVNAADVSRFSQLKPYCEVRFSETSAKEARAHRLQYESELSDLASKLEQVKM